MKNDLFDNDNDKNIYFQVRQVQIQGLCSLGGWTSYRKISWNIETARLDVIMIISLKVGRHLGNAAAEVPVKFQSDWKNLNLNLLASGLHEILR